MKERVLVTGAAGFIGSHLLPVLVKEGYEVVALDVPEARDKVKGEVLQIDADICDGQLMMNTGKGLSKLKIDAVIHLAAIAAPRVAEKKPEETFRINVYGTLNVLRMAKEAGVKRVVFPSTAHVYGISPKISPTPENTPLQLQDDYTISKLLGEQLCQLFYENHNISYVTFRIFNGYGPRQSLDYFIPAMINKAKHGEIVLKGAKTMKDWVFINDIINAIVKGLETDYVGPLNVGTGVQTSLESIAKIIAEYYGAKFSIDINQPPATFMQADITRIKTVIGWCPMTILEEGLRKTLEWYKVN